MLRSVIIIGTIISGTAALAEPASMRGQAIKELVPGSVIHIDTPLGSKLPVRYTDDGLMSGEAGGLASYLGSATDRGKWWVENDKLCQKWFKWFDAEIKCLQLRQQGQRIFWNSDDGKTGTATIAMRTPPVAALPLAPAYAMSLRAPQSVSAEPAEASVAEPPITAPKPQAVKPIAIAPKPVKPAVINQAPPEKTVAALPLSEAASKKEKSNSAARTLQQPAAAPAIPPVKSAPEQLKVATSPQLSTPANPAFKVAGVGEDDVLNIRNGPSSEHPPVGAIPADGQGVRMAGSCQSEWCPIVYRGVSGWVNRIYLIEDVKLQGSAWLGANPNPNRERRLPN